MPKTIATDRVLEATLSTLVAHGYDGATTKLIAAAAGINEVTLFRKFGNKTNLVLEAVKQEAEAFKDADVGYSGALEADLIRVVTFYDDLLSTRARVIPLILDALPRHPELQAGLRDVFGMLAVIMEMIERYQAEGKLVEEPPIQTLSALLGSVLVLRYARAMGFQTAAFNPRDYVRTFLNGRQQLVPR